MAQRNKGESPEIVVFSIIRDSTCAECGRELWKGELLRMEGGVPLCMACADLDHLAYLSSGDAALTRRANRYSPLRAVVVRFSRARKRYERQGVLVRRDALERAERECLDKAELRRLEAGRAGELRHAGDEEYRAAFAHRLAALYPGCAPAERDEIADHALSVAVKRVWGPKGMQPPGDEDAERAVRAHVRRRYTPYDDLLADGRTRAEARAAVHALVEEVLARWRGAGERAGEA